MVEQPDIVDAEFVEVTRARPFRPRCLSISDGLTPDLRWEEWSLEEWQTLAPDRAREPSDPAQIIPVADAFKIMLASRPTVPGSSQCLAIRQRMGATQKDFARAFGFSLRQVRIWERGDAGPSGAAAVLLAALEGAAIPVMLAISRANSA
jgi:DNA-binding XRE family transcriptional regulator